MSVRDFHGERPRGTAAIIPQLPRKTFIRNRDFEVPERRARLHHRKHDQAGDQQGRHGDGNDGPDAQIGHVEAVSGTEQGHGPANLPALPRSGNCLDVADRDAAANRLKPGT